jgi:hypothetical protein
MDIQIEFEGIAHIIEKFNQKTVQQATSSALNKTADQTLTFVSKEIREEYNITAAEVRKNLRVTYRANNSSLTACISGKGRGFSLFSFSAKQAGVIANKKSFRYTRKASRTGAQSQLRHGGAVTVLVRLSSGRKEVHTVPKAFIQQTRSGTQGVFMRKGKERTPLKFLYGPGVGKLLGTKNLSQKSREFAIRKFRELLPHELAFYLGKNS